MVGLFSRTSLNFLVFGSLTISLIVGLYASAVCAYLLFVWSYIPPAMVNVPVNFDYSSDMTPLPIALFTLPELGIGNENYKLDLELNLPRSKSNKQTGNFMARFVFSDELPPNQDYSRWLRSGDKQITKRTTILPYKSELVEMLDAVVWAPLYAFSLREETMQIHVQPVDLSPSKNPRYVIVDLSKPVELAGASLTWRAQLAGLRYLIATYPVISFMVGSGFVFFIELVFTLVAAVKYLASHPTENPHPRVKIPPEEMEAAIEEYIENRLRKEESIGMKIKQEPSFDDEYSDPTLRDSPTSRGSPRLRPKFQCSAAPATSACPDSSQGQMSSGKMPAELRKRQTYESSPRN